MARLSRNDIVARAREFAHEWRSTTSERSDAQSFWIEFLQVFGVNRRRVNAAFERHATRTSTGNRGYIDLLWPGMLLAEHKSANEDLDAAMSQAVDYIDSLEDKELPRLVIVSDFKRIRTRDWDDPEGSILEFKLEDLPKHVDSLLVLAGYAKRTYKEEDKVNVEAAELLGKLYDELEESRYSAHLLRVFIVRVLFLLFGDDSGLWQRNQFADLVQNRTAEDGSDLGLWISRLFSVVDTPAASRTTTLDLDLAAFPYVNGGLFSQRIEPPDMTRSMRDRLLEACNFNWSEISPAIFGAMFQSVMDPHKRRALGAHYTSEENILKTIEPLFLDEIKSELASCENSRRRLENLHNRLSTLRLFDPACGCGNFLVIAYREVRKIEREILKKLHPDSVQMTVDLSAWRKVSVDQFYGIEYEEFPARIAETAMYLMDHLENERLSETFGINIIDLPLSASAHIHMGNALCLDWNDVLSHEKCTHIFGNPPFVGQYMRSAEQTQDLKRVWGSQYNGYLDYVTGWYAKIASYDQDRRIKFALVSTNSISQGQPVGLLWHPMLEWGYEIDFAHRSFVWASEARGRARVHCIIVGLSAKASGKRKRLFEYPSAKSDPVEIPAQNISPYLFDGPDTIVATTRTPIATWIPKMSWGSKPVDQGNLIVELEDYESVAADPIAAAYLRPYRGSSELLDGADRWCLWLIEASPKDIAKSPILRQRVSAVSRFRSQSKKPQTRELAASGHEFAEIRQPKSRYLAVPQTSSENRRVIPMMFLPVSTIASNALYTIPGADNVIFGFLQSTLFTTWVRAVSGRLRNDFQLAPATVYNTFPFPAVSDRQRSRISTLSQDILSIRESRQTWTLSEMYAPDSMPSDLASAHNRLDRAVENAFGKRSALRADVDRLPVLFESYLARLSN